MVADDRPLVETIRKIFAGLVPPATVAKYLSDPREEAIVRYTRGTGTFSKDKQFITLNMKMYTPDGDEDGSHQGVWHATFADIQDLYQVPAPPTGPMDQPKGPVDHIMPLAQTKAIWTFGDRSSITAVGPALSHVITLKDKSFIFLVTCAQIITGGTGRYDGAYGLKQSLGATHATGNLFDPETTSFEATTVDTFRVIRKRYYRLPSPAPSPSPTPQPSPPPQVNIPAAYPFTPKQMRIYNSHMSYIDEGKRSEDAVVFLHGNPTWSYLWRNIIPALSPYVRCIAPDLIGMGRSGKPSIHYTFFDHVSFLDKLVEELHLKRITLVIHDWGSALGFRYASQHKDQIRGIAFMEAMLKPYESWDTFPASDAPPQLREVFREYRTPGTGWDLIVKKNQFMEQTFQLAGRPLSDEEKQYYQEPFETEHDRKVIYEWPQQIPIEDDPPAVAEAVANYSQFLTSTNIPKLLVYTKPGAILTQEHIEWAENNLPNLRTENVGPEIAGPPIHLVQEAYPKRLGEVLSDWYRRLSD